MKQIPRITDRELKLISDLVYKHAGIRLGPEKRHLVELRLGKILRTEGIGSYEEYYRKVLLDKSGEELKRLLNAITTNFTQFFREPQHFDFLKQHVIPELESKGRWEICIWSAACATGEEPYSIAITLLEIPQIADWSKEIIASDISTHALSVAKRGLYPEEALKEINPLLVKKYFVKEPQGFRIKDQVKEIVKFMVFNLLSVPPWREHFDVIFCRNAMIYFDKETRRKVVDNLREALKPGGFLIVGHVESLFGAEKDLRLVKPSIYRKSDASDSSGHRGIPSNR